MPVIVQKYGGTSVADAERIRAVAERVVRARGRGDDVVVVVSAMGHTTDQLLAMAHDITPLPNPRELDLLLTAGERIAMSLLAIAVNALGCPAAAYTGSQAGVVTDTRHGAAKIVDIRPGRIRDALAAGTVVIVGGFQGVSTAYDVTTLGRGGSDTTAVALAAALGARWCEIYTDVPGVFTADPRIEPSARKLHAVSYEEMLELAGSGAKVLQLRSVEYARRSGVMIHVRSSFSSEEGTWVKEEDVRMEQAIISGVAHDDAEAKITVQDVPHSPGAAASIFRAIADEGVSIDTIVQHPSRDGRTDLSFTAPKADLLRLSPVMERVVNEVGASRYAMDDGVAKVSVVGAGIRGNPGIAAEVLRTLGDEGVVVEMIAASSIRLSCIVRASDGERAVRALHRRFGLGGEASLREEH